MASSAHFSSSHPKIELFDEARPQKAKKYIERLDQVSDWTLFRTSHGYLGRGPQLLQQDDQICVFLGGRVPFVICKTHSTFFRLFRGYRLLGECYVEGLMKKEATWMSRGRWLPIVLWWTSGWVLETCPLPSLHSSGPLWRPQDTTARSVSGPFSRKWFV